MANEISISLSVTVNKNGAKFTRQESFLDDMAGDAWITGVQQVTTDDLITHEDIATYGWVYLKNLDTGTDYVDFSHDASAAADDLICRLYAGESCLFKTSGITALHAKSSSGTQAVEYAIIEL
jgi:hypothetical protein